jgi:hypothetical protein
MFGYFFTGEGYAHYIDKNALSYILGDFFTSTSGHSAPDFGAKISKKKIVSSAPSL